MRPLEELDRPEDTTVSARNRRLASHLSAIWRDAPIEKIERFANGWIATVVDDSPASATSEVPKMTPMTTASPKKSIRKKSTAAKKKKKKGK